MLVQTPSTFSKVLPYKWEEYCRTNGRSTVGFPFFKAWKPGRYSDTNEGRTAVQIGGVLQYFLPIFSSYDLLKVYIYKYVYIDASF